MNPIVIQMHGLPGSGKSTLARAIAPRIGAIVLDKDVIKAALLRAGIPENKAGTAAYEVYFSQAQELISLGHSVILDNPVYWPIVEQRWKDICEQAGAPRLILECMLGDDEERARRLGIRHRLESQPGTPQEVATSPGFELSGERIVLDTTRPIDELVEEALRYIETGVAA